LEDEFERSGTQVEEAKKEILEMGDEYDRGYSAALSDQRKLSATAPQQKPVVPESELQVLVQKLREESQREKEELQREKDRRFC